MIGLSIKRNRPYYADEQTANRVLTGRTVQRNGGTTRRAVIQSVTLDHNGNPDTYHVHYPGDKRCDTVSASQWTVVG